MHRKGFALLEIILAVAVLALLGGGGWYISRMKSEQNAATSGINAEKQAQEAVQQTVRQTQQEQGALSQLSASGTASSTAVERRN